MNDLLTNATPVAAGSWVSIVFGQSLLGAANITVTWPTLAQQWSNYLPATWGLQQLLIANVLWQRQAVVQVRVAEETTIGAIARAADVISPDVKVVAVVVNGASPASAGTLQSQLDSNKGGLTGILQNPVAALQGSLTGIVIAAVILTGLYLLLTSGAGTRLANKIT